MDAEARFRALFEVAYPALGRYAHHRGLNTSDASDLVAAALEVAWRRLDDIPAGDPLPWLYAVAHNLWRNQVRSSSRREALIARVPVGQPQPAPEPAMLDAAALRRALALLDEADQEILRLVAWDGLTPSQAAVVLGCKPSAARARLHRARNRLALHLGMDPRLQRQSLAVHIWDVGNDHGINTEVPE